MECILYFIVLYCILSYRIVLYLFIVSFRIILYFILLELERKRTRGQNSLKYATEILQCKAIPLQGWRGPEGSSRLRLPDFKTIGT